MYECNRKKYYKSDQTIFALFQDNLNNMRLGIYATRAYSVLLTTTLAILIFYTAITVRVRSITVSNPSIEDFEYLQNTVAGALVCPCTKAGIRYSDIFTVSVARYHQV